MELCLFVFVLGWKCSSVYLCVPLSASFSVLFLPFCACAPVHHISFPASVSLCVFPAVDEIFISSSGVPVTPRGCAIRGTARPSGQPSRFIISQHQRDRRGNSTDQWAEVEARLNFLFKVCVCVSLTECVWCVFLISLTLMILTGYHSCVL